MTLSARPADGAALARLLTENDLPTEDLGAPGRVFFEFCDFEGGLVGIGGLELYGEAALLRSVVTLKAARGGGYGRAIVEWLAAHAANAGARELYLLTFSAPGFFCGLRLSRMFAHGRAGGDRGNGRVRQSLPGERGLPDARSERVRLCVIPV